MDDFEVPPSVFANHVIKQMVDHSFGGDLELDYQDYMVIRTVFRRCGGSWGLLCTGDLLSLSLLGKIVVAWGQMPERKSTSDRVI